MFPAYLKPISRYFRSRRNRPLVGLIEDISRGRKSAVGVLDIGGSRIFWTSIPATTLAKCEVTVINL